MSDSEIDVIQWNVFFGVHTGYECSNHCRIFAMPLTSTPARYQRKHFVEKKNGAEILSHIGGHIRKSETSQFHMRIRLCDSRFVGQVSFSTTKYYLSPYTNAKVLPYIYMYILISAIQKSNCSTNKWHCSKFFFEFQFGYIEYFNHYNNALLLILSGHP